MDLRSPASAAAAPNTAARADERSQDSTATLIDKASQKCGSDSELARRIGLTRFDIYQFRNGRPISLETTALLCDVLGLDSEDSRRMALDAVIDHPKNAHRADVLRRVLFG